MSMKKVSDEDLIKDYKITNSVWSTAVHFGMCGQSVHERLCRLGVIEHINVLSDEDKKAIEDFYNNDFLSGDKSLDELAKKLNRTKNFICRYAKSKGLTKRHRKKTEEFSQEIGDRTKQWIKENGHPKGMLGKKHTEEVKKIISKTSKERWDNFTEEEKNSLVNKQLKNRFYKYGTLTTNTREKCSWKAGWREIGGKRKYFRSKWEANYARYLEFLKQHNCIKEWQHESKTFWFEGIKRGCRSYLPDFEVTLNNGDIEYHEVKGWYDKRSQTKTKRMAKYYPKIKLIIIFEKQMKEIKNKVGGLIKDWER